MQPPSPTRYLVVSLLYRQKGEMSFLDTPSLGRGSANGTASTTMQR